MKKNIKEHTNETKNEHIAIHNSLTARKRTLSTICYAYTLSLVTDGTTHADDRRSLHALPYESITKEGWTASMTCNFQDKIKKGTL